MTVRLADAHYRKGASADDLAQLLNLADRESQQVAEAASEGNLVPAEGLARLLHANPPPSA